MRLIDADALIVFMRKGWRVFPHSELQHTCDMTDIDNAPTIDAVPVVRCSECEYAQTIIYRGEPTLTCNNNEGLFRDVPYDGFCYCGARMDGET